jgi:hypothetical protein
MSLSDSQNLLSQLNDIIAPSPPSFWPLPAIFWILLVVISTTLIGLFIIFKKYKKQHNKQKIVLKELQKLQQSKATFIQLNQLLKGTALLYFPRQDVASLHGEQWFDFLQRESTERIFQDKQSFLKRLYNNNEQICSEQDFTQAKVWIKSLNHKLKSQQKSVIQNV